MASMNINETTEAKVDTTVSLESHLFEQLHPLLDVLPLDLRNLLDEELKLSEIHYSLLARIARWARSDDGKNRIVAAKLNLNSYHMVSLLAGTRTAPSSKLPPYKPPESPEARAQRDWNDRRALTTIINSILSIACTAIATWWAADKASWRPEWKALLALAAALVVGSSEAALFLIWQTKSKTSKKALDNKLRPVSSEKQDSQAEQGEQLSLETSNTTSMSPNISLRRRTKARITE